jgi:predicted acyltransferase
MPETVSRPRSLSLDAFRGITIAAMILVNNPGSWSYVYPPLRHAEWHGWTPTDLIFPFFLFIVGVAIEFAVVGRLERGESRTNLIRKIVRRSLILILLGLLLAGFPRFDFSTMRFPGVLQRIGLVYLLASLIVLKFNTRGQVIATVGLLLGYWLIMMAVPVLGYGAGDLSPDGNLAAYVDRLVFGDHIWRDMWDPEGLLSTIPAVATAMLGVFTGKLLRSGKNGGEITSRMFVLGWAAIILGLFWGIAFPINKNLWTSSYVLFTTGAALQFLGVCHWLIDVKGYQRWAHPAVVFGRNAIVVFVLSGLLVKTLIRISMELADGTTVSAYAWIYRTLFVPWAGPLNGSLAFAIGNILIWYGLMELLYRKRIFVKI